MDFVITVKKCCFKFEYTDTQDRKPHNSTFWEQANAMKTTYYLAVDIGASSGRHILGSLDADGHIQLEEVYRFPNGVKERGGHLTWDLNELSAQIIKGMQRCAEIGKIPSSMGIDTWGVDYVLLDENDQILGDSYAYRDSRTAGMDSLVFARVPQAELYQRTGIQHLIFNTIFQLYADKMQQPQNLARARTFLMVPDYLHFLLTGRKLNEYTNATTTSLVNLKSGTWDVELLQRLGLPDEIFSELNMPGTRVGPLLPEIADKVGYNLEVVLPATHDTGSAVMAKPGNDDDSMYLSSGTWSLIGMELKTPQADEAARRSNFTHEGGYDKRYRFLKNIMGLWMMQNVRREFNNKYSFAGQYEQARSALTFPSRVDVNDEMFLAPRSMVEAVREYCRKTGQQVPETDGELLACIYLSLAQCYRERVDELQALSGRKLGALHIIGGGCQDQLLNALTAAALKRPVYAGPVEATAIGNIICQMIAGGVFADLAQARDCVAASFDVREVQPEA